MALDGARLGLAIWNALDAAGLVKTGDLSDGTDPKEIFTQYIGPEIVNEITTNAVVPSGITVVVDPNTGNGDTTGTGTIT